MKLLFTYRQTIRNLNFNSYCDHQSHPTTNETPSPFAFFPLLHTHNSLPQETANPLSAYRFPSSGYFIQMASEDVVFVTNTPHSVEYISTSFLLAMKPKSTMQREHSPLDGHLWVPTCWLLQIMWRAFVYEFLDLPFHAPWECPQNCNCYVRRILGAKDLRTSSIFSCTSCPCLQLFWRFQRNVCLHLLSIFKFGCSSFLSLSSKSSLHILEKCPLSFHVFSHCVGSNGTI